MILKILILIILILINGLFSATEIAFLSIDKYKLSKEIKKGNKKALKIAYLLKDMSTFLSVIQIIITLSGFLASAFAASSFATALVEVMHISFISKEVLNNILVVIITLLLSYFSLVFGELVPKKIGLASSFKIAFMMINVINIIIIIFRPIINILKVSTDKVVKMLKIKPIKSSMEDEIKSSITDSNLEELEKELLLNVFDFNDITLKSIMVPKSQVISLDVMDDKNKVIEKIRKYKYTRLLVFENNKLIGYINIKDFLIKENQSFKLRDYVRKIKILKSDMIIDDAYLYLKSNNEMIAAISFSGEYAGIVTQEDIIEEIIGKINDEYN